MKHMNIVVSIIIAAAVLVAAYAVGLLVRHARTPDSHAVLVTEDSAAFKARVAQQLPGGSSARGADGNLPAEIRQQREQMLEKMKTMTEEEKRKFTQEQVRNRFSAAGRKGRSRTLSPDELAKMMQKRQAMSEEERRAFDARMEESQPAPGEPPQAPSIVESPTTPRSPEPGGSEPNKAGQG